MKPIERYYITFYGRVQGVGFRYNANILARSLNLSGWVENMFDGSVICEVQGDYSNIIEFIRCLKNNRHIQISNIDMKEVTPIENDKGFDIR